MIITNSIVAVKKNFETKDQIKTYIYGFIENHPFRKYNNDIAKKYGEDMFSMTFIKPNRIILTQKYMNTEEYEKAINLRKNIIEYLFELNIISEYSVSEPFEVFYK